MKLPFTFEEFLDVFTRYNKFIFPFQILLYIFAGAIIYFLVRKKTAKLANAVLAFLWLWTGVVYHVVFFSPINAAAFVFGLAFIIQAALIVNYGVIKNKLSYQVRGNTLGFTGLFFVVFALFFYPVIGYALGHVYPASPTFGAPCPTTIFTLGIFLWSTKTFPKILLIIPFLWSLIGFSAATTLGMSEDISLLAAGLIVTTTLLLRKKDRRLLSPDTDSSYSLK